ncbi:MAG: tyrosine-type recombinase/integrase [Candidatus Aegiribacteria sp.]|nr:tyrosine-type recombinase/integrase [Candidatus Aegiribacteria sp.]
MIALAPNITAFFRDYLGRQRGASLHTCDTYAYSFKLLLLFASERLNSSPSSMSLDQIDARLVTDFLEHLENVRGCTPATRNVRLAAIKSFFRYLEYREPAALEQIRQVLAIPFKKTDSRLVSYLNPNETKALLDAPDLHSREGIRDYAMFHLALSAGLRVSELTGLCVEDVSLQPMTSILVRGKGRRERALPLWKETATALRRWLAVRGEIQVPELFVNARGGNLSRWGFAHILSKHVEVASQRCPSLRKKRVSPHVLRHTCAMVVIRATHDIRKVSLWLGHSSIQTTDIYTRVDPSEKLEAINAITPLKVRKGRFRPPDELIARLKNSSLWGANQGLNSPAKGLQPSNSP